jgi:hypothetical protein
MKENALKKYRWLYLWIASAALLTFAVVLFLSSTFRESFVFYVTGAILVIFVIIRFIPLVKTSRENMAIALNVVEMLVDMIVGILMIILTAKLQDKKLLDTLYPFLIGGVIYARALVYFVEISFLKTKPEKLKFFIHIALLTVGSVIMARFDNFNPNSLGFVIGVIFALSGVFTLTDGIINYNNYRKLYVKVKKEVKKEENKPLQIENSLVIDDDKSNQDYVS